MDFQVLCPNVGDGCGWCGKLHELEIHVACCNYRPSHCLYCRTIVPYNLLPVHSQICLSNKYQALLEMEAEISLTLYQRHQPEEVKCPNVEKGCPWQEQEIALRAHLYQCVMEEHRPADCKRCRFV